MSIAVGAPREVEADESTRALVPEVIRVLAGWSMMKPRLRFVQGAVLAVAVAVAVVGCSRSPGSHPIDQPGPSVSTSGAPMDERAVATCEASENDLVAPRLLGAVDATVGDGLEIAAPEFYEELKRNLSGVDSASYAAVCFYGDDVPGRTNVLIAIESGESFIANVT